MRDGGEHSPPLRTSLRLFAHRADGPRALLPPPSWIFLLFGVITVALGIISWFVIVDFPDRAKFLTPEQKTWAIERIQQDRGDATPDSVTGKKLLMHALECVPLSSRKPSIHDFVADEPRPPLQQLQDLVLRPVLLLLDHARLRLLLCVLSPP